MNPGFLFILILLVFFIRLIWAVVGIAIGVVIFHKEIVEFLKRTLWPYIQKSGWRV